MSSQNIVSKPKLNLTERGLPPKVINSSRKVNKADNYLFGQFSKTNNLLKTKPRNIFDYQIPTGYKKTGDKSASNKPLIFDHSNPKILHTTRQRANKTSDQSLRRKKLGEEEIGNMTIRELGKLDPERALEELTIKYKKLKVENQQMTSVIDLKDIAMKDLESEIKSLKSTLSKQLLQPNGKPYTETGLKQLQLDSQMNKHSLERISYLEKVLKTKEQELVSFKLLESENQELKGKLKSFDTLKIENEKLQMEVTKLKTQTLIFKRKIQKLSMKQPTESNSKQELGLTQNPSFNPANPVLGETQSNIQNMSSNKMEIDRICSQITSLISKVKTSSLETQGHPSKQNSRTSVSKEGIIKVLREIKLKTMMLTKTSSIESQEPLKNSQADVTESEKVSKLLNEIKSLQKEVQSIGIYERQLNEKNLQLKSIKKQHDELELALQTKNKEITFLERSLKQANQLLGVKNMDAETKINSDLEF